jgi:acyl-coenzyme A synthetase/AMP-(fatty) acid ligase
MGIRPRDLNYALVPLGHSYGLGSLTIPLFAQGVPPVCGQTPLPHAIARDLRDWSPTVFPGVPAIWRALASSDVEPGALGGLRLAISAGAPLPPDVAAAYAARFGRRLLNFYGSSETGGIAFDRSGRATLSGGVGRAVRGVEITALPGGRIRVCGAAVFTHGNRRRRGRFGCWVPPDRVAFDARGVLRLTGRCGTTAKIAGRRVDLAEVAARLRRLPGVRDAWISVRPGADPILGAVLATDRPVADLRAALHGDTALWKTPRRWLAWPSLPLTARGKVDTRLLSARLWDQRRLDLHQQLGAADVRPQETHLVAR